MRCQGLNRRNARATMNLPKVRSHPETYAVDRCLIKAAGCLAACGRILVPSPMPEVCGRAFMHNVHKMHNDLKRFVAASAWYLKCCVKNVAVRNFVGYACIAALALLPAFTRSAVGQEDAE